jgi:hypothetical protein
MSIIENWRSAWRMFSMQVAGAAVIFGALPAETQAAVLNVVGIPSSRMPAVIGLLMIVGRLVAQPKLRQES